MLLESSHCTEFGGRVFEMHPSGALYWPSQFSLLVADLHFEKGSSYHKTGQFLPPYDTKEILNEQRKLSFQMNHLPVGTYFLRLNSAGKRYLKKVLKTR